MKIGKIIAIGVLLVIGYYLGMYFPGKLPMPAFPTGE